MPPLEGELGVEKKGSEPQRTKPAVVLFPKGNRGGTFVEFACAGGVLPVVLKGELLFPIPANKTTSKYTFKLVAVNGKQKPEKFEGGPTEILEASFAGNPSEQIGLTLTALVIVASPFEVNTVT